MDHQIVAEEVVSSKDGFGYRIECSCHQLIDVWPEHFRSGAAAETLAHEQWGQHCRELSVA
jgi:hypothetical protein